VAATRRTLLVQRRRLLPGRPGRGYAHELRTRLLEPLDLDDTYLPRRGENRLRGPHTHGYVRVDGRLVDVSDQTAYAWAEGGLVSTTHDLGPFLTALLAGRVVPQPFLQDVLTVRRRVRRRRSRSLHQRSGADAAARWAGGLRQERHRVGLPDGHRRHSRGGHVLSLSLTTTGNGDGSDEPRLFEAVGAAFGVTPRA
jgi:D-alanyl-D-alanine carboxypeptidase